MCEPKVGWQQQSWFWTQQFSVPLKGAVPSQSFASHVNQWQMSWGHRAHEPHTPHSWFSQCAHGVSHPSCSLSISATSTVPLLGPFPTYQPASPLLTIPSASVQNMNLHTLHCKAARALLLMGPFLMAFSESLWQLALAPQEAHFHPTQIPPNHTLWSHKDSDTESSPPPCTLK